MQTTIPLAVLPIAAALGSIPIALEEAASVLGASRLSVYRAVILPLAWPGIAAGAVLVFGFNTGAFVVPLLLGGLKVTTIAVLIRNEMGPLLNWPLGAALSVVLVVLALGIQALNRLVARARAARMNEVTQIGRHGLEAMIVKGITLVLVLLLLAPIVMVVAMSFTAARHPAVPAARTQPALVRRRCGRC